MSDNSPKGPRNRGARKPFDGPRGNKPAGKSGKPFSKPGDSRPSGPRPSGAKPFAKKPGRPGDKPFGAGKERPGGKPYRAATAQPRSAGSESTGEAERIAKRLARAGVASRRDAEDMIAAGRVKLNGKVLTTPAINVSFADHIEIDDKPIPAIERTRLFLFNKPMGVVTTSRDPEGRKTVFDVLPGGLPRLISIGRLDINTEGLLLLTNDGGLARQLELPATGWLRRYRVRVHGKVDEAQLAALKDGIAVEGVYYGAIEASLERVQGSNAWLTLGLREGKNREVKNVLGALGLDVTRLIRVSYGPFQLGDLADGELKEINGATLREQLGERLVEAAGANFDAPILKPFSGKTQSVAVPRQKSEVAAPYAPGRKPNRDEKRSTALGKLSTRPERARGDDRKGRDDRSGPGGKGPRPGKSDDKGPRGGKPDDKANRQRGTHVWMAPGARPLGEKKAAEKAEQNEGRRYAGKPRPASPKPRRDK
ncbi:MAG: pseudouridine synthase [Rhizobiaceae bacterium]